MLRPWTSSSRQLLSTPTTGLYEIKYDGFRALAYIDGECELVSRKGITYKCFQKLREQMKLEHSADLGGEIVCLDRQSVSITDALESKWEKQSCPGG